MWQHFHIVDDAGACRREARHRFKKSISQVGDGAMNEKGEHAEEREDDPCCCHHDIGVATTERILRLSSHSHKEKATACRQQRREQKSHYVVLASPERYAKAPSHEERLDEEQRTNDFPDDTEVYHILRGEW